MVGLFLYTVAIFGAAYVVGHSVITRPAREVLAAWAWDPMKQVPGEPPVVTGPFVAFFVTMIECPACLSFWLGLAAGLSGRVALDGVSIHPIVLAAYTTGASFILGRLTGLMPSPNAE